jgi:nitrate reductase gamma subunit
MLRKGLLRLGSNLFHYGVIIVIIGHFAGFLAPHWAIDWALSPVAHQLLAMVVGGIAGIVAIIGLTILLARRLGDPRIRLNSRKWDIAVALMLWLQLALGLLTVPLSAFHMDGVLFETLTSYVKGIVTFNAGVAALMIDVPLTYKLHILLGFSLFLVSPFTRMIHIWSGVGSLAYLFRPYQIVRTPKTRAKEPVRS